MRLNRRAILRPAVATSVLLASFALSMTVLAQPIVTPAVLAWKSASPPGSDGGYAGIAADVSFTPDTSTGNSVFAPVGIGAWTSGTGWPNIESGSITDCPGAVCTSMLHPYAAWGTADTDFYFFTDTTTDLPDPWYRFASYFIGGD